MQYRVHPRVYNDNYEVLENLQELAWRAVARQSQDVPKEIFLREVHELAARQDHRLTVVSITDLVCMPQHSPETSTRLIHLDGTVQCHTRLSSMLIVKHM